MKACADAPSSSSSLPVYPVPHLGTWRITNDFCGGLKYPWYIGSCAIHTLRVLFFRISAQGRVLLNMCDTRPSVSSRWKMMELRELGGWVGRKVAWGLCFLVNHYSLPPRLCEIRGLWLTSVRFWPCRAFGLWWGRMFRRTCRRFEWEQDGSGRPG